MYEFQKHTCNDDFEDDNLQHKHEVAEEYDKVNHMQPVGKRTELDENRNIITRKCYGPVYVLFNEDGQNILIPQMADMSTKDN